MCESSGREGTPAKDSAIQVCWESVVFIPTVGFFMSTLTVGEHILAPPATEVKLIGKEGICARGMTARVEGRMPPEERTSN